MGLHHELFRYFATLYRHAWMKSVPRNVDELVKAKSIWYSALRVFSVQDIKASIKLIQDGRSNFTDFPPNPQQFAQLCKLAIKNSWKNSTVKLNIKSSNPVVARENLKKCWAKLGVKAHESKS